MSAKKSKKNKVIYLQKAHPWTEERKRLYSLNWSGANSPGWLGGLTLDEKYQREQRRRYYEENKEHLAVLTKRSHDKNRERYLLLKRIWQKNNYEKCLLNNKRYRLANPDKVREWRKRDWEKHRERINFKNRQRELRERNAVGVHTFEEWQTLKAKYNYQCVRCKRQEPEIKLTRDHIVPLTKNGLDSINNIQPLCGSCNSSKNNRYIMNYLI